MQRLFKFALLFATVAYLSACTTPTPEQQAAWRAQAEARERQEQEEYLAGLRSRCDAFGFVQSTPAYAQCVQREDLIAQQRKRDDAARQREADRLYYCRIGGGTNCDGAQRVSRCQRDMFGTVTCITN